MKLDDKKFLIMIGPNVIESEKHTMFMASELKKIFDKYPQYQFIFKTSFDKANRTSVNSYRGLGIEEGLRILQKVKDKYNLPIITDIHEGWQCELVAKVVDILQIPAFLCRQTDLIKAAAKTNKIIHVKKGQFLNSQSMLKVVEKLRNFGHTNKIILCERGNMYGYNDLIVDTRNLIWLKGNDNMVSMDITHCLQQPSQTQTDGTVKAGGLREFVPLMGKIAIVSGVDAIFMEVHDCPEKAKCDGPTQWHLNKLEHLLVKFLKLREYFINYDCKNHDRPFKMYVGYDSSSYSQKLAYDVCQKSIKKHNSNVEIVKIVKQDLIDKKLFWRDDNTGSTEFTYTRFLVPYLNNYQGWALFCDNDFLWKCNVEEILEKYADPKYAVCCVKHDYTSCNSKVKMDGKVQEYYPRKNWSSLMLFNCSHPSTKKLTLENVSTKSPAWLHRMQWAQDDEIGEIDKSYNYLVGYYNDNNIKALHFTDGGPWYDNYKNVEHADEWLNYL